MDQADDNSLTALLTKRDQVRFREIINTCTERRAEKRINLIYLFIADTKSKV